MPAMALSQPSAEATEMTRDLLAVPRFLAATRRLSAEEIYKIIGRSGAPQRSWAPIRTRNEITEKEETMAKINLAITNRNAVVEVWAHGADEARRHFANMDEFEAWYRPSIGRFIGGTTSETHNLIMLEEIKDPGPSKTHIPMHAGAALMNHQKPDDLEGKALKLPKGAGKTIERGAVVKATPAGPSSRNPTGTGSTVIVDGKEYGSVLKAFIALGLPVKEHQKFRKFLKVKGEDVFVHEKKKFTFKVKS